MQFARRHHRYARVRRAQIKERWPTAEFRASILELLLSTPRPAARPSGDSGSMKRLYTLPNAHGLQAAVTFYLRSAMIAAAESGTVRVTRQSLHVDQHRIMNEMPHKTPDTALLLLLLSAIIPATAEKIDRVRRPFRREPDQPRRQYILRHRNRRCLTACDVIHERHQAAVDKSRRSLYAALR